MRRIIPLLASKLRHQLTKRRRLLTTLLRLTPLLATKLKPNRVTQQRLFIILQQLTPLLAIIPQLVLTTRMLPLTSYSPEYDDSAASSYYPAPAYTTAGYQYEEHAYHSTPASYAYGSDAYTADSSHQAAASYYIPSGYFSPYDVESAAGTYEESLSYYYADAIPHKEEARSYYPAASQSYQELPAYYDATTVAYYKKSPSYYTTTANYGEVHGHYLTAASSYYTITISIYHTTECASSNAKPSHYKTDYPYYTTSAPNYYTTSAPDYYTAASPSYYTTKNPAYHSTASPSYSASPSPSYTGCKPTSGYSYERQPATLPSYKHNSFPSYPMLLAPSIVAAFLFNVFREEIDDRRIIFKTNKVPCTPNSSVSILGPFPSVNCTSLPYVWCMRYLGIWNAAGFFCTSFI
ncbi:Uncharacterized protein APZ42_014247 [Daphnia magna]|uniref:Uncharacterized protein n=1 Tax=Daphnia magna TaxID=35525 RepID=A0A162Q635_9CRUS|nr:Uncharacterized protein APZ42_014247 [Daphnia magna]